MLWLVIELNIFISIFCFYLAWRIWKVRQTLLQVEQTLNLIDNCTNKILGKTPEFFQLHQQKINQLRQLYKQLDLQVQQVKQIMAMLWLLRTIWHRFYRIWR
ncbi:MAG: hypothetical protein F6K23_35595 [Okeania sp. SIO2C9]|uniref:hypothetical protein n=1 Tax=Okeania sp. SIO2C9 TaxID=2607791 RepID=UPI0013BF21A7|nr:hypothetical protein [Okeania sp. SIO2C9]NEQ77874.1 hypothetical protein [Okeania sp. SIO2C9]